MRGANFLRIIDLCGQLLMLLPLAVIEDGSGWTNVIFTYCTLGSWQLISLLANWYGSPGTRPHRARYARIIRILACITASIALFIVPGMYAGDSSMPNSGMATLAAGTATILLDALLFIVPILAVWYFGICLRELRDNYAAAVHRREIHWKM